VEVPNVADCCVCSSPRPTPHYANLRPPMLDYLRLFELHRCAQLDYIRPDGGSGRGFRVIRDDLLHPVAGGNKLRKLDALLPALLAAGTTDVVRVPRAALCPHFRPEEFPRRPSIMPARPSRHWFSGCDYSPMSYACCGVAAPRYSDLIALYSHC